MITFRRWKKNLKVKRIRGYDLFEITREGWFLFDFIPLFIRDAGTSVRPPK